MPNGALDVAAGAPNAESYVDNGDGTITDAITGLMWQKTVATPGFSVANGTSYCATLNLGTHLDWHLPSFIELVSILDYDQANPTINAVFSDTPPNTFWSSTPKAGTPTWGWYVGFKGGDASTLNSSVPESVRCVRSMVPADSGSPAGRYVVTNGTVYDTQTKLTWAQTTSPTTKDRLRAEGYCMQLDVGGKGWRLPTEKELLTLVDLSRVDPSGKHAPIDPTAFPMTTPGVFWSSTAVAGPLDYSWVVDFSDGVVSGQLRPGLYEVRCVR